MGKVISIVNRKGGVAKTTSAAYLSMCIYNEQKSILGIDTDPDLSWLKWHSTGTLPYKVISANKDSLKDVVQEEKRDFIVIDTPPNDDAIIYKVASLSDEVIIPLAATALDMNRLPSTLSSVADVEEMRNQALASVLLTKWSDNLVISREVKRALEERKTPLLDSHIRNLTRYQGFNQPTYLREYEKVLLELELI